MRLLPLVFLAPVALVASTSDSNGQGLRRLDDDNTYLRSGKCFRMKIAQDNDDDAEGNSYFYNGAYRAQYERYVSFFICNGNDESCSDSTQYVQDMDSYLDTMTNYVQNLCGACANCRRRLEDEEDGDEDGDQAYDENVDCSSCPSECSMVNDNDGSADETDYLDCQYAQEDGDLEYYSAPQCDDGKIRIGLYYDDECTIKTNYDLEQGFSYGTFKAIEQMAVDCSSGDCNNLYQDAVNCDDVEDGDEYKLCKVAEKAGRVPVYYKKPWYKKFKWDVILGLILVSGAAFFFLAYAYFVRHTRPIEPLATLDHEVPEIS